MEKGMRCVPKTTERLSVSGFTVVWLIKADEPKAQRMLRVLQCCSVARGDSRPFFRCADPRAATPTVRPTGCSNADIGYQYHCCSVDAGNSRTLFPGRFTPRARLSISPYAHIVRSICGPGRRRGNTIRVEIRKPLLLLRP